jgi:transposase
MSWWQGVEGSGIVVGMRRRNPPPPLAERLLPDALWQRIQPLLPPPPGGGAPRTVSERACMAAIIFMCRTSTPWALLPVRELGCGSVTTCWNRFAEWARAGVFDRLQVLLLDELGAAGLLDWSRASVDSASVRAVRGGSSGRKSGRPRQAGVQVAPGGGAHRDGLVAAAGRGQPA